jgi:glycerate 2-kinase
MRALAHDIFSLALREVSIEGAFERNVQLDRNVLRIAEDLYDLGGDRGNDRRVLVISIGKAAYSMLDALYAQAANKLSGIAVGPSDPTARHPNFSYFHGGHPVPNADSVRAAQAILESVRNQKSSALIIYLLSGGGSALAEKPISDQISLDDLVATYSALVLSGAPIVQINAIRKHLSAIKGGRLAAAAVPAQQLSVLVSDVPDNAPDALASGPTMPDSSTVEDCYAGAQKYRLLEQFPPSVRQIFEQKQLTETPKSGDPTFARSRWWTILSNRHVQQAAAAQAARAGFAVEVDNHCDDWDYAAAADYLLSRLRELRRGVERVCLISGGEVTVRVTNGGCGGRNQQFTLFCATKIAGENIAVVSAGTDGVDGNSPAAGAVVDGTTLRRATAAGYDPTQALQGFNAFPLFEALGDAILTGPTGNNLRDLRILLAY